VYTSLLSQGDTSIDVYVIDDTWLPQFAAHTWVAPVDSYAKSHSVDTERILPAALEASRIDGRLMALPWTAGAGLLYYRHDLLDKYGHAPPTSWEELQQIALDVKSREKLPYGYVWQGAAYESLTCNTLEFVWAYGGEVLDQDGGVVFDSPETHAALQAMLELLETDASPASVTSFHEGQALTAFQAGEAVFMRNWAYAWTILNDDDSPVRGQVSVMTPPASCYIGQSLVLSAYSLHAEEAFRLMAFLVDDEQQVQLANTDQPPALETAYDDADLLAAEPFFDNLHAALSASQPRPRTQVYRTLSQAIYTEVNEMLSGAQDVRATVGNIQGRIKEAKRQP
jgi:multiple sugar transport system substrate-binding protein